ncbi:permease [Paenibacillus hexagrammi]|uniref:Permease n=1 Tax=Paenibacillus hexagrammi TaxID=2908839 RepID=A0ABY3SP49_9BACL|nr:permease [Paenibacillus sp. YPD9-1]UJF34915.1 permease [Paenibacillus sp. YPD9-1]
MTHTGSSSTKMYPDNKKIAFFVIIFLIVAFVGLTYVKWWPYYHKALDAATKHTIGSSIVSGKNQVAPAPSWQSAWDYALAYYKSVWKAAVLGILLGSLVQVLIPANWLFRVLGKTSFGSTVAGGLASIPGMMCTCCAAPIAVGLRKKNASVGSTLAFWLGNPTINPATLVFMTFVLSWKFTLIRLVFGLLLTFGVSYMANRFAANAELPKEITKETARLQEEEQTGTMLTRWLSSVWSMIIHLVPSYLIAVLVLGAARAWLFPAVSETSSNSLLVIAGFAIAGMLFVIPTAAEIPIIQTLLSFGLGTGPAAALLITLPSVSLPSLLMVSRSFPRKVLLFVTAAVIVLGIASGITGLLIL